ncbi:hypothetical protein STSP2_02252 [Anaerohalosphaera lusitana]|uniref:Putative nickel insertion protein n=1 Tax=Anaerohalosphaera lusitana TaxID=1936003 RepID=A0A1U9NMP0_9BACT|nr:nickel pincer cofactor biosynthesis protein LarC [Anaerohalosphaera lusitana]AQT69067.1 hypothetical protein STSP2_02252 [Anaerohalosphaera lusitana]
MKIAYLDCFAGAAGDMFTSSMLHAGADKESLIDKLQSLKLPDLQIQITEVMRSGISCCHFKPTASEEQPHRHLPDIVNIIEQSDISERAKKDAVSIFEILADAEAKVHNKTRETIHFHEVGAVDSIVDIISACVCVDLLGIEKVICSPVTVGFGMTKCAHGQMPVPAPATAEILQKASVPTRPGPVEAEMLTPTGAAIIAHFVTEFGPPPQMAIENIGYGAGTADHEKLPNALRIMIGCIDQPKETDTDTICLLETNIDDLTGEQIGDICEVLLDNGALDVFTTPIYMKKSRPAVMLSVICEPDCEQNLTAIMFSHGITLGIRRQALQRSILKRRFVEVDTEFGTIPVKIAEFGGCVVTAKPEFDKCRQAADKFKVTTKQVEIAVMRDLHI